MRTATVYVATDGRQFKDAQPCKDHEHRLFNAWLKDNPAPFEEFIKADPDQSSKRRALLMEFWEFATAKPPA